MQEIMKVMATQHNTGESSGMCSMQLWEDDGCETLGSAIVYTLLLLLSMFSPVLCHSCTCIVHYQNVEDMLMGKDNIFSSFFFPLT